MSEMNGSDLALPLWTAAGGLALFFYGFGFGGKPVSDLRVEALSIGLAGAIIFVAGLAALETGAASGV